MTNTPSNEAFNPDLSKSKIDKTDAQLTSNRQASDRQDVEPSTDIQANLETNMLTMVITLLVNLTAVINKDRHLMGV